MIETSTSAKSRIMETDATLLEEPIYIHNAGLVILAPFLKRYFQTLGLVEGRSFQDPEQAARAVHLLQYLVSGQSETPEHLLVFNKVLCGLPIETPIPISIEISEEEIEVSSQLLNSVLQNWDKMQNSTEENLRGSFLIRNGRLMEGTDRWSLTVEPASYDILLEFLPWTISTVMLPWMSKRVEVEWKTVP